jgi:DDE domain
MQRFTPLLADAARFTRHAPGDRWFVDETYVKVNGVWRYVYRAIDQHGQVIDVLLSSRRDAAAARRFFTRALRMLKMLLRPMRGLRTDRTAQVVMVGHAFVQNLRRGHYELGVDAVPHCESPRRSPNSPKCSDRCPAWLSLSADLATQRSPQTHLPPRPAKVRVQAHSLTRTHMGVVCVRSPI